MDSPIRTSCSENSNWSLRIRFCIWILISGALFDFWSRLLWLWFLAWEFICIVWFMRSGFRSVILICVRAIFEDVVVFGFRCVSIAIRRIQHGRLLRMGSFSALIVLLFIEVSVFTSVSWGELLLGFVKCWWIWLLMLWFCAQCVCMSLWFCCVLMRF